MLQSTLGWRHLFDLRILNTSGVKIVFSKKLNKKYFTKCSAKLRI